MRKQLLFSFALCGMLNIISHESKAQLKDTTQQKAALDTAAAKRRTPEGRAEALTNRLKDKLELKDNQVPKLKEIFTKQEKAIETYFDEMRKSQERMMEELATVLDTVQLQKFKEIQGRRSMPPAASSPSKGDTLPPMKK